MNDDSTPEGGTDQPQGELGLPPWDPRTELYVAGAESNRYMNLQHLARAWLEELTLTRVGFSLGGRREASEVTYPPAYGSEGNALPVRLDNGQTLVLRLNTFQDDPRADGRFFLRTEVRGVTPKTDRAQLAALAVLEGTEEARTTRRELVRLLVESVEVDRTEEGRTRVRVTYRFGPPSPPGPQNGKTQDENVHVVHNSLEYSSPLVPLVSVVAGLVLGELLGIENRLRSLGDNLQRRFSKGESPVSRAFVTTSLLFCVGPLTVIGSLQDGLKGDYSLLALKSALDFIAALTFASVLGWGVLLSAGTVLFVQGALTLGAGSLDAVITESMISATTATGGILILGLGLMLLELKEVRVANMLPALLFAPLIAAAAPLWPF